MLQTNNPTSHQSGLPFMDDSLPSISLENEQALYPHSFESNQPHHSPSPSHSASPIDIPFALDNYQPSPAQSNFNYPGTPSYQGSHPGSFGSQYSASHNWGGRDDGENLHLFDDNPDEYNPSEYDVPDNSNHMYRNDLSPFDMINDDFDFTGQTPSVSVVPAETLAVQQDRTMSMENESPASSLEDPRSPSPMRSRTSSIGSSHGSPHNSNIHLDNPNFDGQWGVTAPSPPVSAASPGATGSRSPPALLIPDVSPSHLTPGGLFPPSINRNLGPGLNPTTPDGPGINLIPATPVSGGGNGATTAPFSQHFGQMASQSAAQTSSETPQRTGSQPASNHSTNPPVDVHMWVPQPADSTNVNVRVPTPSQSPHLPPGFITNQLSNQTMNAAPYSSGLGSNPPSPYRVPSPSVSPQHSPIPVNNLDLAGAQPGMSGSGTAHTLGIPYVKRERSKSDTFSQRPGWALGITSFQNGSSPQQSPNFQQQRNLPANNLSQLESNPFGGFTPSSADAYTSSFPRLDGMSNSLQHANSFGPPMNTQPNSFLNVGEPYLSVDQAMRRSRSDAGGHRRGAKSEDFSHSSPILNEFGMVSPGLLAPPNHPSLMVPSDQFGRGRSLNGLTHHRRNSSGSRGHERHGSASGTSSVRASPYPSPNASPMIGYAQLQPDVSTVNMHSLNLREMSQPTPAVVVARPHVTTSATQAASATRRTSEASFTCPVPGCGSTFTRHFNLKGHMRSHNDERPFKCKWPGCEKGFARQHDCKRHEQLHLNIRPYTCEGCQRTFARMDALNRHLRSEGGAECAKHQQPLTEEKLPKQEEQPWLPGRAGGIIT